VSDEDEDIGMLAAKLKDTHYENVHKIDKGLHAKISF